MALDLARGKWDSASAEVNRRLESLRLVLDTGQSPSASVHERKVSAVDRAWKTFVGAHESLAVQSPVEDRKSVEDV